MSKPWKVITPIAIGAAAAFTLMLFPYTDNTAANTEPYSIEEEWEERPKWITDNDEGYIVEVYRKATDKVNVARVTSMILRSRYGTDSVNTDTNFITLQDYPYEGFTTLGLKSKIDGKVVNVKVSVSEDGVYTFADDYYDAENLLNTAKEIQEYSNYIPVHRTMYENDLAVTPLKNPPHGLYTVGIEGNNYFGYIESINSELDGKYKENITYSLAIDTNKFTEINYDRDLWEYESTYMYNDFEIAYPHHKLDVSIIGDKKTGDYHIDENTNSFYTQINAFYNETVGENNSNTNFMTVEDENSEEEKSDVEKDSE